ncbi:MAG: bifunctional hydroxymethylpyrimidine kinase/phosphomethylpyrimidine kinase [Butyricicoccus sp.]
MKTVLSIAGTDPTGGAGIQTDLKTFEAFGVYGMAVITVVCAQNTTGVFGMQPVSAELVGKQIDCVFDDIFPDAVKVGMLYDAEIIHTVAERLKAYHAKNIVLDPVMMSSSGTALLHHDAAKVLQEELFPLCTLVTPNLHEAAAVCSHNITNREDMEQAAREIVGKTGGAVLVKGGHLADCADDLLFEGTEMHWLPAPRIDNPNTHGTGCTLSSAIACGLTASLVGMSNGQAVLTACIDFVLIWSRFRSAAAPHCGLGELACVNCGAFPTQAKHFNFSKCKQEKVQRIQGQKAEEGFLSLHSFTLHRCCFTP